MSINNEGTPAPVSIEAQAIAELEKEGHIIGTSQPDAIDGDIKDIPKPAEEKPKIEEKPKEEIPKPDRSPTMVETWKLKVAEDQKAGLEKELTDLKAKVEELSKQKTPITQTQTKMIAEERQTLADELGISVDKIDKLIETTLKEAEAKYKPSADVEKTIKQLTDDRELEKQLNEYSSEFEKDVIPLVKDYQLSDQALSDMKTKLRDLAFSETYMKVPLKEIFQIKQTEFNLSVPKKSSEGKGIKTRASEMVDLDNLDEESFKKLEPEQVEQFVRRQSSGSWNTRK